MTLYLILLVNDVFSVTRYITHPISLVAFTASLVTFYFISRNNNERKKLESNPDAYVKTAERLHIEMASIPEGERAKLTLTILKNRITTQLILAFSILFGGLIVAYVALKWKPEIPEPKKSDEVTKRLYGNIRLLGGSIDNVRIIIPKYDFEKAVPNQGAFSYSIANVARNDSTVSVRFLKQDATLFIDTGVLMRFDFQNDVYLSITARNPIVNRYSSSRKPKSRQHEIVKDTMEGSVVDRNGKGVSNMSVAIPGHAKTKTDPYGFFRLVFDDYPGDNATLIISGDSVNSRQEAGKRQKNIKIQLK